MHIARKAYTHICRGVAKADHRLGSPILGRSASGSPTCHPEGLVEGWVPCPCPLGTLRLLWGTLLLPHFLKYHKQALSCVRVEVCLPRALP